MSGLSFPRVPVNPRLEFGVSLDEVCEKGTLHPGLRDLFLKAYLSGAGDDPVGEEQFNGLYKIPYVLQALEAGPKGQGKLDDRISLKLKLESGKWIIAAQTPAGTPLWLLRHFLGCLPQPLLYESHWQTTAIECGALSFPKNSHRKDEVLKKILTYTGALPKENCVLLMSLILLIRNLSRVILINDSDSATLHQEALEILSQYFTAAIISRPYRPGLHTVLDKGHEPLLVFMSEHWLEVEELCQHTGISPYYSTCELRYEFTRPDRGQVDYIVCQATTTSTADNIHGEIDVSENFTRKQNQQPPQILKPQTSTSDYTHEVKRITRDDVKTIDSTMPSDVIEVQSNDRAPMIVHMPKGVYLIPTVVKHSCASVSDEGVTRKVMEDQSDCVELTDVFDLYGRFQVDIQEMDNSECLRFHKVVENKSNKKPKIGVRKLINKYEDEAMLFTEKHQALECDGLTERNEATGTVMVKINGTQTFECEFSEESLQAMEIEKLQESGNYIRVLPVQILRNTSNIENFFKIRDHKAIIPLTNSIALLIENLKSDEEIVYLPAGQVMGYELIRLSDEKVIDGLEKAVCSSKTNTDVTTLTNPLKDVNDWKDQKKEEKTDFNQNSDFVTELKNNFKQGLRKPSDAKLSSHNMVLANESRRNVNVVTRSFTQQLLPKTYYCVPISSANSI